jgi:hypothetical protein
MLSSMWGFLAIVSTTDPRAALAFEGDTRDLSTPEFVHHELFRIDRDFGKEEFEIVLDGWLPRGQARDFADVRFWWVKTDDGDLRRPFSEKVKRHVEFDWRRRDEGGLSVRFAGDRKEFVFSVELDERGRPGVYADVELASGRVVRHCRGRRGHLVARRFLGIPVGIRRLEVRCTDAEGRDHRGTVAFRTLAHGRVYDPASGS